MQEGPGLGSTSSGAPGGSPCQICGTVSPPGTRSCPVCHANLRSDVDAATTVACAMCGGVSPATAETCPRCGASLVRRGDPARAAAATATTPGAEEAERTEEGRRCACGAVSPLSAPACIVCGTPLLGPLKYEMIGTLMPALEISLEPGQRVYGQTHCLGWMTETIQMRTLAKGSPWALLGRVASGMTLLVTEFSAPQQPGLVAFTTTLPGRIMKLELAPDRSYVLQPGAFLAAQDSVSLHAFFNRNLGAGLFGGEGFILQRISGYGIAFIQIGGEMVEYELPAGEVLLVDPGSIAAFDSTVRFSIRMVRGIANIVLNQGLFLAELRGPGHVWVETLPLSRLIAAVQARLGANAGAAAGVRSALTTLSGGLGGM
jgi:uncharacterized protein (TIGR00266 family)